ncbi:MAG: hypothetical protein JXQ93_13975 [Flavobacteriaceae bacterium]
MSEEPTLESLKKKHALKKQAIKNIHKRRFNDLFLIIMPLLFLVYWFEDAIGGFFSNSKSFIYFFIIAIAITIGIYLFIIQIIVNKIQKEINVINSDIYKLMKLVSKNKA